MNLAYDILIAEEKKKYFADVFKSAWLSTCPLHALSSPLDMSPF